MKTKKKNADARSTRVKAHVAWWKEWWKSEEGIAHCCSIYSIFHSGYNAGFDAGYEAGCASSEITRPKSKTEFKFKAKGAK